MIFVGLGLGGAEGLTLGALETLSKVDIIYLESYTNPINDDVAKNLSAKLGKEVSVLSRETIEDGRIILDKAGKQEVALIVSGDPMVATTHGDLRTRALQKNIHARIIHNASIISALPGETGLQSYRFGKTVTLTSTQPTLLRTAYSTVYRNLLLDLHSILLLQYDYASKSFLAPGEALTALAELEADEGQQVFTSEAFIIVASRLGRLDQSITGGKLGQLLKAGFGEPPQAIIVPGKLHFAEEESLGAMGLAPDSLLNNSSRVKRKAARMVPKYVAKTKQALQKARAGVKESEMHRLADLFENVECYLSDAERFLSQGEDELAVLSIGYAEGLLDSLRFKGELAIDW
ncbi:MAG: diphthine synthase [Thaumarchaeota archaeon]|nr:diphthine synthase [Nitrososphaerota archaeon]